MDKSRLARRWLRPVLLWGICLVAGYYALMLLGLIYLKFFNPVATTVQVQRRVESFFDWDNDYDKRCDFVPLSRISRHLQRAVVAAEDGRFYEHNGIDFEELEKVLEQNQSDGRLGRGASTITQQLTKNLFLTTHRNVFRKAVEFTIAPVMELVLSKERILELYLNVIEWGRGIYGAQAASQHYYRIPASRLGRQQSARLAACIPSPRTRTPSRMDWYSSVILQRMSGRGW
ncbi:MAG: monofunctional biosynthetic peptidoglycan transglycosylase [Acidobacteriota bacterium]